MGFDDLDGAATQRLVEQNHLNEVMAGIITLCVEVAVPVVFVHGSESWFWSMPAMAHVAMRLDVQVQGLQVRYGETEEFGATWLLHNLGVHNLGDPATRPYTWVF